MARALLKEADDETFRTAQLAPPDRSEGARIMNRSISIAFASLALTIAQGCGGAQHVARHDHGGVLRLHGAISDSR